MEMTMEQSVNDVYMTEKELNSKFSDLPENNQKLLRQIAKNYDKKYPGNLSDKQKKETINQQFIPKCMERAKHPGI